ncbi:MAG: hypothetical protein QM527_06385 [Alphaproteobacteria bacterium]|nr:hypothetical protein [Alphaproteobacteria bacterium]
MPNAKLSANKADYWSKRNHDTTWKSIEIEVGMPARKRGYLTMPEFLEICRWKSPRSQHQCILNPKELVEEVTAIALAAAREELRIGSLILLKGVSWPTASTILHFCHEDPYPILDFRAVWSLRLEMPNQYDFDFWWAYTEKCRKLATAAKLTMRQLDMALWQYSKEKQ